MQVPKASLQILTYNAAKYVQPCLDSIKEQTWKDFEVLVLDNASSDETVSLLQEYNKNHPELVLRIFESKENLGFSKGHNMLLSKSESQYVVLVNQDMILEKEFLEKSIAFLDEHSDYGSVSPKVLRLMDGKKTSIIDSLGLSFRKTLQAYDLGAGEDEKTQTYRASLRGDPMKSGRRSNPEQDCFASLAMTAGHFDIFGPSGTCPVHRREALESISFHEYLDEDFFMYKDDLDTAFRMQMLGWKSACVPEARVYHARTAKEVVRGKVWYRVALNRKTKSSFVNFYSYRNHWFFILKNIPRSFFYKNWFPFFYYEFKKLIFLFLFEQSTLKAIPEIWHMKKRMKKKRAYFFSRRYQTWEEIYRRMFMNSD